jgi:hypothetical protein
MILPRVLLREALFLLFCVISLYMVFPRRLELRSGRTVDSLRLTHVVAL